MLQPCIQTPVGDLHVCCVCLHGNCAGTHGNCVFKEGLQLCTSMPVKLQPFSVHKSCCWYLRLILFAADIYFIIYPPKKILSTTFIVIYYLNCKKKVRHYYDFFLLYILFYQHVGFGSRYSNTHKAYKVILNRMNYIVVGLFLLSQPDSEQTLLTFSKLFKSLLMCSKPKHRET